jgi:tetratricopeptide (TPR) repeat protein
MSGLTSELRGRNRKVSPFFFQLAALIFSVSLLATISHDFSPKKSTPFVALNPEILPHLVLGFRHLAADMLWLRLIQDIDYKSPGRQEKGWVFQMLDGITRLDPRFRMAYGAGATVLSVLIQDVEGARILFERAAENFPSDWSLLYRGGYHYLYEVRDCKKAAEFFNAAVFSGAPKWVASLASRLYQRAGQYEIARSILIDSIERFKGTEIENRLKDRLAELDKNQGLPADTNKAVLNCLPPDGGKSK